jgi:anti-sigma factor RsiW
MKCNKCHTGLMGYLEGTLPEGLANEIGKHLKSCSECAGFEVYLRETLHIIDKEKHMEPRPYLYTRIKGRMTSDKQQPQGVTWTRTLQPAVFSLLLLTAILSGVMTGQYLSTLPKNDYISESLTPLVDEMKAEPLELFLLTDN